MTNSKLNFLFSCRENVVYDCQLFKVSDAQFYQQELKYKGSKLWCLFATLSPNVPKQIFYTKTCHYINVLINCMSKGNELRRYTQQNFEAREFSQLAPFTISGV